MEPLVSVLTPTYNRPLALCEMLEGLRRQTVQDFEAIVVNDAGEPVDIVCRLYPELDIRIINLSENVKHCRARNEGLKAARGSYVMFCDDDDLLLPRHLERMLDEISGCDLVYSDAEIVGYRVEDGRRVPLSRLTFAYRYDPQGMREFSTFIPSGCLYKKEIHDVIGPFDDEMYHYWDWDFILRVSARWRVKRVPAASVLYAFSQEGDNASADTEPMRPYLDKLCAKHGLGFLPTKNFFLLLEEEGVRGRKADTEIQWDGMPIGSRCGADRQEGRTE
ncbi:glycosyltransferase family 2 protein [Paenibacillus beijingensis]|uniref:Glycosyltransferase n=1 Tax=Paenibacillus beijingensis TaxID=1126833 RepID=A0A0D5NR34_9BACL|nr:glycosyltransferase family 2 protein [Paenibacillus beijingensis]AJY77721.1 glycosyltransferase [Paenibacillus beijingensis]